MRFDSYVVEKLPLVGVPTSDERYEGDTEDGSFRECTNSPPVRY